MLTLAQYNNLWTNPMPLGFARPLPDPDYPAYADYLLRENQIQDYLDLFRGYNSRGNAPVRGIPEQVQIEHGYDHPFEGFFGNGPMAIKYILIAEAAPSLNPPIMGFAGPSFGGQFGDTANTFFYNINHLRRTPYFSAVMTAFGIPAGLKATRLFHLAQQGVLLLDLFPFSLDFGVGVPSLRQVLINAGVSSQFWGLPGFMGPETIGSRIEVLRHEGLLDPNLVRLAFLAPPVLMHFLADQVNLGVLGTFGTVPRLGPNTTIPCGTPPSPMTVFGPGSFSFSTTIPAELVGLFGNRPIGAEVKIPYYACTCYNGANNPASLFIQNALL
jgi:hypothetical protein